MASRMRIELKGLEETARLLERYPDRIDELLGGALYRAAERIMAESKERFVPVDLGNLRNSGFVEQPRRQGGETSVALGFGGPAAPYALYVHENLQANHTVGQAKFLETPFRQAAPTLDHDIAEDIRGRLR